MNVIQHAVSDLKFRIPRQILEKAFVNRYGSWKPNYQGIDELIINNVIKPRVLVDCNLIGGTQAIIPLNGLPQDKPTEYTTVVHIPKDRTQGRSINSVLHIAFISPDALSAWAGVNSGGTVGSYGGQENTALMGATHGMMAAFDRIPMVSTARVELIAENTILATDTINLSSNCFLRCVLSNDENFSNIPLRSYRYFCNLIEYAVKAYIYNALVVEIDQGELAGGQTLGIFKEIIQGYSEAEENYQDYLKTVMQQVMMMSDNMSYHRFMKLVIGGNR